MCQTSPSLLTATGSRRFARLLLFTGLFLVCVACSGGGGSDNNTTPGGTGGGGNDGGDTGTNNPPPTPPPPGPVFKTDKTVLIADTRIRFISKPDDESRKYVDGPSNPPGEAEIVVYLPPVYDGYRGVLFFDGSSHNPRYYPGYCAEVWQFVSIAHGWDWQDRVTVDNPDYLPRLLKGIADYTKRPEIERVPWAICPRQAGNQNIVNYAVTKHPEKVIGLGLGFGDNPREWGKYGFPVSYALEIRHEFEKNTWKYGTLGWADGSLSSLAGEQGFSRHYNNSKPDYGLMLISRAVLYRLKPGTRAANGTTTLVTMKQESGWLGALKPLYSDFNEIAPFAQFSGDRTWCSWLADEEFAVAWRGYMTPDPLILITQPSSPMGLQRDNYLGRRPLLDPGSITFNWELFTGVSGKYNAHLSKPDPALQARIQRVDLYQGGRHLGGASGSTGTLSAEFGPGVHLVVAIATLDDGSKHSSWPVGFGVRGDMYAPSGLASVQSHAGPIPLQQLGPLSTSLLVRAPSR